MATLKDMISRVGFEEVWALLGQDKESMAEYREAYENIFREMQETAPEKSADGMVIRFVMEEEPLWDFYFGSEDENAEPEGEAEAEDGPTLQVYGFVPGDDEGYAIGLRPTATILGMDIDPETEKDYSPAEIAAHCIAEMSYNATMASSAYGTEKDTAGGGLLASQACMSEDIQNIDLNKLRESIGAIPKQEDLKEKYGFLF